VICLLSSTVNDQEREVTMGETGKKDKGKKEQKKKPKLTIKEKRKQKHEKKETA
jgi:hypothetical protein